MFNHAHFWFSLGSSVADTVINTETYFQNMTKELRHPRATDRLKGPPGLERLVWTEVDKPSARARLGLPQDGPILLTIGSEPYYKPANGLDFFATLAKLLAARPDLHAVIVGVSPDCEFVAPDVRGSNRVHLVGRVNDPRPYYEAADLCLESWPLPSLGAVIEAVAYGQAFPVPAFAERENPLRIEQPDVAHISPRRQSEAEYLAFILDLLDDRARAFSRAGEARRLIIQNDVEFGAQFPALYERLSQLGHSPQEIPRTECVVSDDTLSLASLSDANSLEVALRRLPLASLIRAQIGAARGKVATPRAAMLEIARGVARSTYHLIPGGIRSRMRK
jgi:hypothetical protein